MNADFRDISAGKQAKCCPIAATPYADFPASALAHEAATMLHNEIGPVRLLPTWHRIGEDGFELNRVEQLFKVRQLVSQRCQVT